MKRKRKRSIWKAYKRKWRRMPREDKVFVIKFLGTAFLIFVVVIVLLFMFIFHVVKGHDTKKKPLSDYALKEVPALSRGTGVSDGVVSDVEKAALIVREETDADEQTSEAAGQLIDNAEVDLLARLIYVEVGDSSKDAQIAAASVILNRVQSEKYPNSISEVIYQPGQYPSISGGAFNGAPSEQALESARYVYQNGSQIPANVLYQSRDVQGSGVWAEYDGEYFCYE